VKKIGIIVSSPVTVEAFLLDQIAALSQKYQVCVVLNTENGEILSDIGALVEVVHAPIVRKPAIIPDLRALLFLINLFRSRKFDAVHSITPKAGLLTAIAGALVRIPVRIHMFTGQVWATKSGLPRLILKAIDRLLATLATHILVDSPSQRDFLISEGVLCKNKSRVLANGSICGVDPSRFRPNREIRDKIRQREGIPEDAVVFLNLGRLKLDKGVLDLAMAFARIGKVYPEAWLLAVGPDEECLRPRMEQICSQVNDRLRFIGHTDVPQEYMAAADVLCLPSYREGFGSVIIEAAATGIPAVASNIYGITDAIEPSATACLHPARDVDALQSNIKQMIDDPALRLDLGRKAQLRAHQLFAKDLVTAAMMDFYECVVI
jgi:glycosyltransferase involved in cell wall biosynthesis